MWADPGVLWKKAPKAIRAMRGKTLQTVPFKGISTVLWLHQKLPQSTVSQAFPSNKSYESKADCNRTPATVLWVPLILGLGSCGPGKLTEKGKFPKVLRGGCKRSFGPREQRSPKSLLLKTAKQHSKSTLWGTPRQVPKIAQKALRGALQARAPEHSRKWRPGSQG